VEASYVHGSGPKQNATRADERLQAPKPQEAWREDAHGVEPTLAEHGLTASPGSARDRRPASEAGGWTAARSPTAAARPAPAPAGARLPPRRLRCRRRAPALRRPP